MDNKIKQEINYGFKLQQYTHVATYIFYEALCTFYLASIRMEEKPAAIETFSESQNPAFKVLY